MLLTYPTGNSVDYSKVLKGLSLIHKACGLLVWSHTNVKLIDAPGTKSLFRRVGIGAMQMGGRTLYTKNLFRRESFRAGFAHENIRLVVCLELCIKEYCFKYLFITSDTPV